MRRKNVNNASTIATNNELAVTRLYTQEPRLYDDRVDILDPDGDLLTTVPASVGEDLLSHLNRDSDNVYQLLSAEGTITDVQPPATFHPVTFYEVCEEDDHDLVLFRSDNLLEATAVLTHLNRGAEHV
jgi:hypothetical protein